MNFTLENANRIISHYQFLIGTPIGKRIGDPRINHILITPIDGDQYKRFLKEFFQTRNNQKALLVSGINPESVNISVAHYSRRKNDLHFVDLNSFLTKMKIEKFYLID